MDQQRYVGTSGHISSMESEKQPNVYKHERTRVQIFFL